MNGMNLFRISRGAVTAIVIILVASLGSARVFAQTESVLYSFCVLTNCADGSQPEAGVIMDASGNFYGTTLTGGVHQGGTVFKLSADGTYTNLHSFGATEADGLYPVYGQLLMDGKGNLYGTTSSGGSHSNGTVFRVSPTGEEKILYNFCSTAGCSDGAAPLSYLIADRQGNLYGTTANGGTNNYGVVFKLAPNRTETVLYRFSGGSDGANPEAGLAMDSEGNLYGTTYQGGDLSFCGGSGCGTVYKVTPSGSETVIHAFCSGATSTCSDGANPYAGVILAKGGLYGATYTGGTYNVGTVFRVSLGGTENVLHSFAGSFYLDGQSPVGAVALDSAGNVYGITPTGGIYGTGVVYEIGADNTETIVYNFGKGLNGASTSNVLIDSAGNLYGTAILGGPEDGGTVFKITP